MLPKGFEPSTPGLEGPPFNDLWLNRPVAPGGECPSPGSVNLDGYQKTCLDGSTSEKCGKISTILNRLSIACDNRSISCDSRDVVRVCGEHLAPAARQHRQDLDSLERRHRASSHLEVTSTRQPIDALDAAPPNRLSPVVAVELEPTREACDATRDLGEAIGVTEAEARRLG